MEEAFDRAAAAIAAKIVAFVDAADKLVNLLATKPQGSPESQAVHDRALEAAYNQYDVARRNLTDEDVSSA